MLNLERNSHHPEIELKQATERYSDHTISVLCKESISQSVSSVAQSCPTLCDPMNHSTPGLRVYHQVPEFT